MTSIVIDKWNTDTPMFYTGDECPGRPGEYISGEITSATDTLFFTSESVRNFIVEMDSIKFIIGDYSNGRRVHALNQTTNVEMKESEAILITEFQDLIVAKSDSGNVQKIYLSNALGLVGIESNDTTYVLN